MFYRGYSILTALARPEAVPVPRAAGPLGEAAASAAAQAMNCELRTMRLSERLADAAGYLRAQQRRRRALEALLSVTAEPSTLERAMDLICMISEESTWSENAGGFPFEDEAHPEIDFQCAETAMLFGWTRRILGEQMDAISPRISGRLLSEVRRRVFSPFLAHMDYGFMRGRGARPLAILCDVILAAILLETDAARRSAVLKQGLRMLDQAIDVWDSRQAPPALADAMADIEAVTDLSVLVQRVTRGELDPTQVYPTADWLDGLLFGWLDGDYFADPAMESIQPALSGAAMFRIGLSAGDEAIAALGARMHRRHARPSATLTGRLMDLSCAPALASETGKPPRLKHAATVRNRLMVSRFNGMTCAMHAGGGHGNAGNILLFALNHPILVEAPGQNSLPVIAGHAQLPMPDLTCESDFEVRAGHEMMSIDLTHAYPTSSSVRSYQRTAMILREEGTLRIVDALDLAEPGRVAFHFVTPEKPMYIQGVLQVGPLDFAWEGELALDVAPVQGADAFPEGLHRITLTTPAPIARAFFTFNVTPAQRR